MGEVVGVQLAALAAPKGEKLFQLGFLVVAGGGKVEIFVQKVHLQLGGEPTGDSVGFGRFSRRITPERSWLWFG